MSGAGLLGALPLLLVFALLCAMLAITALGGSWMRGRQGVGEAGDDSSGGYLLSATLALLGLLIGFTFSMALGRYDARRAMVVSEANAIGTTWLRAGLVEGPAGDALRTELRAYAQLRVSLPEATDPVAVEDATGTAQARVWNAMRAGLPSLPGPLTATLVTTTNEMFDAASTRRAEREARIPATVLDVLVVSTLLAGMIVGYVLGGRSLRRHRLVMGLLFVLLALAVTTVLDLDRPWSGTITISQAPMRETLAAMH